MDFEGPHHLAADPIRFEASLAWLCRCIGVSGRTSHMTSNKQYTGHVTYSASTEMSAIAELPHTADLVGSVTTGRAVAPDPSLRLPNKPELLHVPRYSVRIAACFGCLMSLCSAIAVRPSAEWLRDSPQPPILLCRAPENADQAEKWRIFRNRNLGLHGFIYKRHGDPSVIQDMLPGSIRDHNNMPHQTTQQSHDSDRCKVAVLGAAGGIGQALSLLLKTGPAPLNLAMYDVNGDAVRGAAADISHIDTETDVSAHTEVSGALSGAQLIIISAGIARKPGMTRDDLFNVNAKIVSGLADSIAEYCDLNRVYVLLISNPVNSLVPVVVNRLKKHNDDIHRRIIGVTQLDLVRASTFWREHTGELRYVPVVGGHAGETIVPLFSHCDTPIDPETRKALVHRVQFGGDEVVRAKNGAGSATLSMAHAAYSMAKHFIELITHDTPIQVTGYVALRNPHTNEPTCEGAKELIEQVQGCEYFSIPLTVQHKAGRAGITRLHAETLHQCDNYERDVLLKKCYEQLQPTIVKGLEFHA